MRYKRPSKNYYYNKWVKPFHQMRKPGRQPTKASQNLSMDFITTGIFILLVYFAFIFVSRNQGTFAFIIGGIVAISIAILLIRTEKKRKIKQALLDMGASNPMQLSPQQYEQFCGTLLERSGWQVQYTKCTGDQGADIIAHKGGEKVVIQCKQWSSSVGVQAVQEVHAACTYYKADKAVVVSTADYTSGAKELAKRANISLVGHEELSNYRNM